MRILQIILIIPLISQNDQNVFRQDFCDLHEAFQFFRKRFLSDNFIPETHSAPRFFSINKGLGRCSLQLEDIEHERINQQRSSNTTNIFSFSKTNIFFLVAPNSQFSGWMDNWVSTRQEELGIMRPPAKASKTLKNNRYGRKFSGLIG